MAACAFGASPALLRPAAAATYYWTGDHDSSWSTTGGPAGSNWSISPDFDDDSTNPPGPGDEVAFVLPGATNLDTALGEDFAIQGLDFTADAVDPLTIGGGNLLTIGAGGLVNNGPGPITLQTQIALATGQTWINNTATPLAVRGAVSGACRFDAGG